MQKLNLTNIENNPKPICWKGGDGMYWKHIAYIDSVDMIHYLGCDTTEDWYACCGATEHLQNVFDQMFDGVTHPEMDIILNMAF